MANGTPETITNVPWTQRFALEAGEMSGIILPRNARRVTVYITDQAATPAPVAGYFSTNGQTDGAAVVAGEAMYVPAGQPWEHVCGWEDGHSRTNVIHVGTATGAVGYVHVQVE